jgi:hypothetical protein
MFVLHGVKLTCAVGVGAPNSALLAVHSTLVEEPELSAAADGAYIGGLVGMSTAAASPASAGPGSRQSRRTGITTQAGSLGGAGDVPPLAKVFDWGDSVPGVVPMLWDPRVLKSHHLVIAMHAASNDDQNGVVFGQCAVPLAPLCERVHQELCRRSGADAIPPIPFAPQLLALDGVEFTQRVMMRGQVVGVLEVRHHRGGGTVSMCSPACLQRAAVSQSPLFVTLCLIVTCVWWLLRCRAVPGPPPHATR